MKKYWDNSYYNEVEYPLKESGIMANFAESNYLEEHANDLEPVFVHGLNTFRPLNGGTHVSFRYAYI